MSKNNWAKIRNKYIKKGYDHSYCSFMADQWEKRKKLRREHIADISCWCEPELNYVDSDTGNQVWLHKELH